MRCPPKVPAAWLPSTVGFKPSHTGDQRSPSEARPAPTSTGRCFAPSRWHMPTRTDISVGDLSYLRAAASALATAEAPTHCPLGPRGRRVPARSLTV